MARSTEGIVYEGWLTKSPPTNPPTKRIWRAKWRRRWFSLKHTGDIPDQYILTYYADRNCKVKRGSINLDDCEQVDLGLKLDDRKLQFHHVFDIKTPTRTYYLAADTELEMKSWVNCICRVCGLKCEDEELQNNDNAGEVEFHEESSENKTQPRKSDEIIKVSTSPYIPISQCITGKTPILNQLDFQTLLEHNFRNSMFKQEPNHSNETYGVSQRTYSDYVNDMQDPRFYDIPRVLSPPNISRSVEETSTNSAKRKKQNHSPLQSPTTDNESVCTDDDAPDVDLYVTKKFTRSKNAVENVKSPPPRPPKFNNVTPSNYMNLGPPPACLKNDPENEDRSNPNGPKLITDETYDSPRSHIVGTNTLDSGRRHHCYNNAVPVRVVGEIFQFEIGQDFNEDIQGEPASPASQTSSTRAYSNLPSPLLPEAQFMPPPMVNRDLKPKRKLSDSLSSSSNPEPGSPRGAPTVDRKLKPSLQDLMFCKNSSRKTLSMDDDSKRLLPSPKYMSEDEVRRVRAAPSPTPPGLQRSCDSLLFQNSYEDQVNDFTGRMQYLDLDLENATSTIASGNNTSSTKKNSGGGSPTVYKQVDFQMTQAFNITKSNLEKERQEK